MSAAPNFSYTGPIVKSRYCDKCTDYSYCDANNLCLLSATPLNRLPSPPPETPDSSVYSAVPTPQPKVSLSAIFDLLMAGKKLQLQFDTKSNAESFRTSLYRFKKRTEGQMDSVGIDFETQQLNWAISGGGHLAVMVAMQLVPKVHTTYTILSIEDGAPPDGNDTEKTQVPDSLGNT